MSDEVRTSGTVVTLGWRCLWNEHPDQGEHDVVCDAGGDQNPGQDWGDLAQQAAKHTEETGHPTVVERRARQTFHTEEHDLSEVPVKSADPKTRVFFPEEE